MTSTLKKALCWLDFVPERCAATTYEEWPGNDLGHYALKQKHQLPSVASRLRPVVSPLLQLFAWSHSAKASEKIVQIW